MGLRKKNISGYIDFFLIGVSSHQRDYSFVWALNQSAGLKFTKQDDLIFSQGTDQQQAFSRYSYTDEVLQVNYNLISNRCDKGFFLKELATIDYLIKISGNAEQKDIDRLMNNLRETQNVIAAFVLNPDEIKDISRLLF